MISFDDVKKVEIKVGQIKKAEKIEGSHKLLRLEVDFGEEVLRQVVSGIALYFESPEELLERKCVFVTNLEPREIYGFESQAMILGVPQDDTFALLTPHVDVMPGASAS